MDFYDEDEELQEGDEEEVDSDGYPVWVRDYSQCIFFHGVSHL